jgi:hypothetical protein
MSRGQQISRAAWGVRYGFPILPFWQSPIFPSPISCPEEEGNSGLGEGNSISCDRIETIITASAGGDKSISGPEPWPGTSAGGAALANWPILAYWRLAHAPGVGERNGRVGQGLIYRSLLSQINSRCGRRASQQELCWTRARLVPKQWRRQCAGMHRYLAPHTAAATLGVPTHSHSRGGGVRPRVFGWSIGISLGRDVSSEVRKVCALVLWCLGA